jgi:hypothetical protein
MIQLLCRALGEYHAVSFVFIRFLGFLDDARNDDDLRLKSSTEHLISDAQGPRLFLYNVRDSGFDEVGRGSAYFCITSGIRGSTRLGGEERGSTGSTTIQEGNVYRAAGPAS